MTKSSYNVRLSLEKILHDRLTDFINDSTHGWPAGVLALARQSAEKAVISVALRSHDFNLTRTARCLGIARKTLYAKMHQHEITPSAQDASVASDPPTSDGSSINPTAHSTPGKDPSEMPPSSTNLSATTESGVDIGAKAAGAGMSATGAPGIGMSATTESGIDIGAKAAGAGMSASATSSVGISANATAGASLSASAIVAPSADKPARPQRALVSVSDKTGLVELCTRLTRHDIQIIATGGTARMLAEAGVEHQSVEDLTGMAPMMDGRVKTLHPHIFAPILARMPQDSGELQKAQLSCIDIVVVNLYPFTEVLSAGSASTEQLREHIDIGGVSLLRAAAKNHTRVITMCRPEQYGRLLDLLDTDQGVDDNQKRLWAAEAFAHTSEYDRQIHGWLQSIPKTSADQHVGTSADANAAESILSSTNVSANQHASTSNASADQHASTSADANVATDGDLPDRYRLDLSEVVQLRYGENPHQSARLYKDPHSPVPWRQLQGKQPSYNNLIDSDCADALVQRLDKSACVIVKHDTPCAVATGHDALDCFRRAYAADSESAFGGIIAFNCPVETAAAKEITSNVFTEVIIAPHFDTGSLAVFATKKNLRLFVSAPSQTAQAPLSIRRVQAGYLVQQQSDTQVELTPVSTKALPAALADLMLAWQVVASAHSNAIVIVHAGRTVGISGGATSRVRAVRAALEMATNFMAASNGSDNNNSPLVLASDAFFPFRDSVDLAAAAGINAIIQPGGSMRDAEVIASANEHNIAMYTTGKRVFRH
ncbi:MAG: bifunctional phosphoribosylaminoimidazolecarboxamide formyltransferase/IMP cyclohydrolase [Proteobacteria bacterium]|nr:bifunctional phosphoribosylaminoimidazolecarboxamide formyltransferase/IMP cyclohydrolase [Pseudomonadota bacterium]